MSFTYHIVRLVKASWFMIDCFFFHLSEAVCPDYRASPVPRDLAAWQIGGSPQIEQDNVLDGVQ